jgi:hypothetical protein
MADALLGMDVMNRKQVNVVTRAQSFCPSRTQLESTKFSRNKVIDAPVSLTNDTSCWLTYES